MQEEGTGSKGGKLTVLTHGPLPWEGGGIVLLGPLGKTVEQVLLSYPARGARKMGLSDLDSSLSLMESLDSGLSAS